MTILFEKYSHLTRLAAGQEEYYQQNGCKQFSIHFYVKFHFFMQINRMTILNTLDFSSKRSGTIE